MLRRKKEWIILLCMFAICLVVPCLKVEAASAKNKALKAYNEFLAQDRLAWDKNWEVPSGQCRFAIVYIDKDNIPELVLYNSSAVHAGGLGRIFTYKNGGIKRLGAVDIDNGKFYYYKKKAVFVSCYATGGVFDNYRKIEKGKIVHKLQKGKEILDKTRYYNANRKEISKSTFQKKLKRLVGSKKKTSAKFYKNTSANRKKRCR